MTLQTPTQRVDYDGDGSTTSFPTTFFFIEDSHVVVIHADSAGVETTWTQGAEYTLTGAGVPAGGTVAVSTSPTDYTPASGEKLVIKRIVPYTQTTDLPADGPLPSDAIEQRLDLGVMQAQQLSEEVARAVTLSATSSLSDLTLPTPTADTLIGWNAAGTALANFVPNSGDYLPAELADLSAAQITALADLTTTEIQQLQNIGSATISAAQWGYVGAISAFGASLIDDADAATARATLGAGISIASSVDAGGQTTRTVAVASDAKRVKVVVQDLLTGQNSVPTLRLVDSGGSETSGYEGSVQILNGGAAALSSGFAVAGSWGALNRFHVIAEFNLIDEAANLWSCDIRSARLDTVATYVTQGLKATSGAVTGIELTMENGTDTFSPGTTIYPTSE